MRRPDIYVPLSVRFATGKTGTAIARRHGAEGLGVWAALLAAWKRGNPPGTLIYASEAEAWTILGLAHNPPSFTFETFLQLTGQLKQTRRTRSGQLTYVKSTRWEAWNHELKRQDDREQKAWKRAQTMSDTEATQTRHVSDTYPLARVEGELEREEPYEVKGSSLRSEETEPPASLAPNGARPAQRWPCPYCATELPSEDDLYDHVVDCNTPITQGAL